MPRKTKNALTSNYNDNYFEEVQNTIVANNASHSNNFGLEDIDY